MTAASSDASGPNYTPTTDDVRRAYTSSEDGEPEWFDRWIAEHDAEVRSAALADAATAIATLPGTSDWGYYAGETENGYEEARDHMRAALDALRAAPADERGEIGDIDRG